MKISDLLAEIRKSRALDPATLELLKQELNNKNIVQIRLWNMSSTYRFLLGFAKLQIYAVALASFTLFPYAMYQKYLQQPQKGQKIGIITPLVSLAMLTPILYYRSFSKKLLSNITYDILQKEFILTKFHKKAVLRAPPALIQCDFTKNHRVKALRFEQNHFNIEGIGEWESIEVFKHIEREKNF